MFIASVMSLLTYTANLQAEGNIGKNSELRRSSVVVVAHPGFNIQNNQSLSWSDDYADISGSFKESGLPVKKVIDSAIKKALSDKGYSFNQKADKAVLVQYHVSLESEMDDTALAINFGMAPGLQANSSETRKYERGTLVVDLISPELNKVVWRGAIGVFTGLEATDEARQQRVNKLVADLFSSIPTAK